MWYLDYCELNGEIVYLSPDATEALEKAVVMLEEVERQAEVNAEKNTKEAAKAAKRERNLVRAARIEEAVKQNPE